MLKDIGTHSYTKQFNALRNRSRTLFDAHPGADIILNDQFLLQLVPYIHQNPVKANMVGISLGVRMEHGCVGGVV